MILKVEIRKSSKDIPTKNIHQRIVRKGQREDYEELLWK